MVYTQKYFYDDDDDVDDNDEMAMASKVAHKLSVSGELFSNHFRLLILSNFTFEKL